MNNENEKIIKEIIRRIEALEDNKEIIEKIEELETKVKRRLKISEVLLLGKKITGTTNATPGTQTTHPHKLGKTPKFVFITSKSNGVVYLSASADATNIYVKGSAASLNFDAYILL